jgi:hypothetical protein
MFSPLQLKPSEDRPCRRLLSPTLPPFPDATRKALEIENIAIDLMVLFTGNATNTAMVV